MSEKEYTVIVNNREDLADIEAELTASSGSGPIPDRTVDVANPRPGSKIQTHFMLTDEEAATLRTDPRIRAVEIPPDQRDDIQIGLWLTQTGNFTRSNSLNQNDVNWGLRRCMETTNTYANNTTVAGGFLSALGGRGVDIVIQDSGIDKDHPEFQDLKGNTRIQEIDWYTVSGVSGTQSANFYTDYDGHGTHCAGISAGKTYGWAKAAHIYAQKLGGLEGTSDPGSGIPISDAFDTIRLWHNAKTNGRPTVVNMSWGYSTTQTGDPTSGNYRGSAWVWNPPEFVEGYDSRSGLWSGTGVVAQVFSSGGTPFSRHPVQVAAVDAEIDDMIADGVHVVIAAGNDLHKTDVPGGLDYDNTVVFAGATYNYHRPSSPHSGNAFNVGNIDYHTAELIGDVGTDITADSSTRGPAIDIWAPGTNIMSTAPRDYDTAKYSVLDYPADTDYKIMEISGTSMAAPQVAGLLALHLESLPKLTPAEAKQRLINDARTDVIYETGNNDTDYTQYQDSIMGAPNKFLYSRYAVAQPFSIGGFSQTSGIVGATYALSASSTSINEGDTVTVTLTTTSIPDDFEVAYAVSGIQSGDLSSGDLSGNFTISSNTATISFTLAEDITTEGVETMTVSLNNGQSSVSITIADTSASNYALSTSAASVNEGGSFTITLATTGVTDGTTQAYTVTGVSASDISESLTGTFTINSNTASAAFNVTNDFSTEGSETFTLSLDGRGESVDVIINDTSGTPVYNNLVNDTGGLDDVNEGETLTFTLTGTNIQDGTTVGYTVSGVTSGDISGASLTGNITMSSSGSDTEYNNGALISENNGTVFDRALTVNGLKLVVAGAVGGQLAVPDEWAKKTARTFELMTDPNGAGINTTHQRNFLKTLKGDTGTKHAGIPTVQRVGYGGGSTYTPNWLEDAGIPSYAGLQAFNDSVAQKDMVWYRNINGNNPPTQRRDIEEIFEHIFHTIHAFGIPGAVPGSADAVEMNPDIRISIEPGFDWQNTALHLAMKEAIDAGLYDPSGYATDWNTDPEKAAVAYTEYTYLINWSMWDMSVYWDGGSLSPEWDDSLKTPAGMLANNPLGYALFNTYFAPVLSKPNFTTIESIFGENDTGVSGYVADGGSGTGSVTFNIAEDATSEGSESLVFTLAATDSNGTNTGGLSQTITINDTSESPAADYTINILGVSGNPRYLQLSGEDRVRTYSNSTGLDLTFYPDDTVNLVNNSGRTLYVTDTVDDLSPGILDGSTYNLTVGSAGAYAIRADGNPSVNDTGLNSRLQAGLTLSSNTNIYDLNTTVLSTAGYTYVAGYTDISLTVNSSIWLYSSSTTTPALQVRSFDVGDTVTIVNNGYIVGKGGDGVLGDQGTDGGNAIELERTVSITNNSYIAGGGGGGGGTGGSGNFGATSGGGGAGGGNVTGGYGGSPGALGQSGSNGTSAWDASGPAYAGGGGGGYILPGTGGSGGGAINTSYAGRGGGAGGSGGSVSGSFGTASVSGNGGSAGNNGQAGTLGSIGGSAGGGGGWGAAGGNAAAQSAYYPYNGGAGGKCVNLNGNSITWVVTGTRYGAIS